jgi:hypothetical protein
MRNIGPELTTQKNLLANASAWAWLYDVFASSGAFVFRLTSHTSPIVFQDQTYQPYPIRFEQITETLSGDLGSVELIIGNARRDISALAEHHNGLRDERVNIRLVNLAALGTPTAIAITAAFRIRSLAITESDARVALSVHPFADLGFPRHRYMRRCRHQFGGEACGWGYNPLAPGSISPPAGVAASFTCDHTLNGPNGCVSHGALYAAAGQTPIHPERFGAEPLIPQRKLTS